MRHRLVRQLRTSALALACIALAASHVLAGNSRNTCCNCYCQGIDRCGCLTNCGGCSCTLCCVINTKTCKFTGSCRCKVSNCCKKSECCNNVWFCQDRCYECSCSVYTCDSRGSCCYTASGCYNQAE